MKKQITKEQWNELDKENKIKWLDTVYFYSGLINFKNFEEYAKDKLDLIPDWTLDKELQHQENSFGDFTTNSIGDLPCIGQMIEFLGNDLHLIDMKKHTAKGQYVSINLGSLGIIYFDNLCDALWEAVKYKLKT